MITLTPFCVSRPEDTSRFADLGDLLNAPAARDAGLAAVIQHFTVERGTAYDNDGPVFLIGKQGAQDRGEWASTRYTPVISADTGAISPRALDALKAHVASIRLRDLLEADMLYVSGRGICVIVTARLVILQAEDIVGEIRASGKIAPDVRYSTFARCAFATLRMAPPRSAHDRLRILDEIPRSLGILRAYRPHAHAAAEAAGYEIGPFTATDLDAALAAERRG